jgi:hypothetical protein
MLLQTSVERIYTIMTPNSIIALDAGTTLPFQAWKAIAHPAAFD